MTTSFVDSMLTAYGHLYSGVKETKASSSSTANTVVPSPQTSAGTVATSSTTTTPLLIDIPVANLALVATQEHPTTAALDQMTKAVIDGQQQKGKTMMISRIFVNLCSRMSTKGDEHNVLGKPPTLDNATLHDDTDHDAKSKPPSQYPETKPQIRQRSTVATSAPPVIATTTTNNNNKKPTFCMISFCVCVAWSIDRIACC